MAASCHLTHFMQCNATCALDLLLSMCVPGSSQMRLEPIIEDAADHELKKSSKRTLPADCGDSLAKRGSVSSSFCSPSFFLSFFYFIVCLSFTSPLLPPSPVPRAARRPTPPIVGRF